MCTFVLVLGGGGGALPCNQPFHEIRQMLAADGKGKAPKQFSRG